MAFTQCTRSGETPSGHKYESSRFASGGKLTKVKTDKGTSRKITSKGKSRKDIV